MSNTPWKIPGHWQWLRVADTGAVVSGGTPSTKNPDYWGGDVNWISPNDLSGYQNKYIDKGAKSITAAGLNNSSAKLMPAGAILFSSRAPIGYVAITTHPMATNQGFKSVIPNERYSADYLYWYFKSAKRLAEQRASGTTFKEISGKNFAALPLPSCSLTEQHRIVEKIEALFSELDQGVKSLETARQQLKVYRQAVLKHAFEGKLTAQWRENNPEKVHTNEYLLQLVRTEWSQRHASLLAGWEKSLDRWTKAGRLEKKPSKPRKFVPLETLFDEEPTPQGWLRVPLGNLNLEVSDGPFGSHLKSSDYVGAGVQVIRLENIGWLEFKDEKRTFITQEKYQTLSKHTVSNADIIFASFIADGTRVVVLPEKITRAINKADCFCIRPFGETINNRFLAFWLATRNVYNQLEAEIHGATRPRINTTQLKQISVPLCPHEEQLQIVQEIETRFSVIDDLEKTIDQGLQKAEALRQSILKKAFAGELVPAEETFSEDVVLHAQLFVIGLYLHTLHQQRSHTFHRTKAEKMVHLAEYICQLALHRNASRGPRGPYDQDHLDAAERCAEQSGWLKIDPNNERKNWVDYFKGGSFQTGLDAARKTLGDKFEMVQHLFKELERLNYEEAELTATVFAAWNDLLLVGVKTPSDARIIREARENWREEKLDYTTHQFQSRIDWLRDHGLAPTGTGKIVQPFAAHPGQVELPLGAEGP